MKNNKKLFLVSGLALSSLIGIVGASKVVKMVRADDPATYDRDATIDVISVSDLTINGKSNQTSINNKSEVNATFTKTDDEGSLIFKFKYDVVDDTASDSNAVRVHFDVTDSKWDTDDSIWMRGDGVYLSKWNGEKFAWDKKAALTKGMHDIEFGRIALFSEGVVTGQYYVYYKVDGVEINSSYSPFDASKMDGSMFLNFSAGNTKNIMYDADVEYEAPQYISVSDLKSAGNYVGNSIPNSQISYTYDVTAANKSVVFFADIDYKAAEDSQIHLGGPSSGNWDNDGCIWIQQDKAYVYTTKDDGSVDKAIENPYSSAFELGSKHRLEYGRLAIMNDDEFAGKYHVYVKLDGNIIYAVDQVLTDTCAAGGKLFFTGSGGFNYLDAYTYEDPQRISVSDLKLGGNSAGNSIVDEDKAYTYDQTNAPEHKSVAFYANLDYVQQDASQIYITGNGQNWNQAGYIWIQKDKVFFGINDALGVKTSDKQVSYGYTLEAGTKHNIEYGRLAVLRDGEFTGQYKVYFKLDGTEIYSVKQAIEESVASGGVIHVTGDKNDAYLDAYTYENAKTISIGDITSGNVIALNKDSTATDYTYNNDAHSDNYSLKFQFYYEVNELNQNQIHLSTQGVHWDQVSSFILLNGGTKFHIGKSTLTNNAVGWTDTAYPLTQGEIYAVELGRLAMMLDGNFTGKYYLYCKIDDEIIDSYVCSINPDIVKGNNVFITTDGKNTFYDMDYDFGSVVETPEFTPSEDSVNIALPQPIEVWKNSSYNIEFDSSYSSVIVDLRPDYRNQRSTDKLTLTGVKVNGDPTDFYHYVIDLSEVGVYEGRLNDTLSNLCFRGSYDYANLTITGGQTYEEPQVVSVSDLVNSGVSATSIPNSQVAYTYDLTNAPANKSVVFKANLDYKAAQDSQIHLGSLSSDNWDNEGYIWIQQSKVFFGLTDENGDFSNNSPEIKYVNSFALEEGKTYPMEYGRLAILEDGMFTGKYHVYFKLNGVTMYMVDQKLNAKTAAGGKLFFTGSGGFNYLDSYTLEEAKEISISDITDSDVIALNKDSTATDYTYTNNDHTDNYSLKFQFYYEVNELNQNQIHLSTQGVHWDQVSSFILLNGGTKFHIGKSTLTNNAVGWTDTAYPLTQGERYLVELGRLAKMDGDRFTGKYFLYVKVDGVLVDGIYTEINPEIVKGNNVFITTDGKNAFYDVDYVFETVYEEADIISVSDLMIDGYKFGDEIILDAHHTYTYDAKAAHKSVIFSFIYESYNSTTIDCQYHFKNGWLPNSAGVFWLRNDKNRIAYYTDKTRYLEVNPFTNGLYKVELGKLYIESGNGAGGYYLYLKVNDVMQLEYVIDSMPNDAYLFTTGTNGDAMYDVNYMPIEDVASDLYLYKWNVNRSGIEFNATLRKDFADFKEVSEVGFIIYPEDDPTNAITVPAKLVEDGSYYSVKAAIAGLNEENYARYYVAKAYVKLPDGSDTYSDTVVTSFYNELEDLSDLSEVDANALNAIRSKVLYVNIDEDNCDVAGATKTGDFDASTIVLTGANEAYSAFILNGNPLLNNELIHIGYRSYKVTLGANSISLAKQDKVMLYGGSEHFHETNPGIAETSTAAALAPMAANLGLKTVRLDVEFSSLFDVLEGDVLRVNKAYQLKVQGVIDELKANGGVDEFLAVFWTIQPYGGYTGGTDLPWARHTAPTPESEEYLRWLRINGEAARICASLFPDINGYETWNEPEILNGTLVKQTGENWTVAEKARILTDLMYYYNAGIKASNPNAKLTTPSLCCSQQVVENSFAVTSQDFLKALYAAIADTTPVYGYSEVDTNANNYFQVINIHPYTIYKTTVENWTDFVEGFHDIAVNYNDDGTETWITEFGYSNSVNYQANIITLLGYAEGIDSVTRLYFYIIHDDVTEGDLWGLYTKDGEIKSSGTAVKEFIAAQNA